MRFTIAIIILAVLFVSLGSGQEPASKASDDAVVYVYATKHIKGILGRVTARSDSGHERINSHPKRHDCDDGVRIIELDY